MGKYFRLLRVKHYIKNILVFMPLFFNGKMFDIVLLKSCFMGAISFSLLSSAVYIFNDIFDVENDMLHSEKRKRPIASGEVSVKEAYIIFSSLILLTIIANIAILKEVVYVSLNLAAYFILNIAYSVKLKNIPIIDVSILASGFFLRLFLGTFTAETGLSSWMYLTIICLSYYFALGKRRNEISNETGNTRAVLSEYTYKFLDNFMYLFLALTIVFYSLWVIMATGQASQGFTLKASIPLAIIACMRYSLIIDGSSSGDPVEVILSDKVLKLLAVLFAVLFIEGFYVFA